MKRSPRPGVVLDPVRESLVSFGFAPMCAFVDHGEHGAGEALALDLRPGRASPHDSADHISVLQAALAQLPASERGQALVRADTGACSKVLLHQLTDAGLEYSVGFPALETVKTAVEAIPPQAWRAARDADGLPRAGGRRSPSSPPGCRPRPNRPGPRHASARSTGPKECE